MESPSFPVFEQSPFSMVIYHPDGRVWRANAAFTKLFGLRLEDVPADYNVLRDPELERNGALPEVARAFRGEAVRIGPIHYNAPGRFGMGQETWTYGHFFPVFGDDGAIDFVALLHVDLTEHIRIEQELRVANNRYRALVEATSAMVWSADAQGLVEDMPGWRRLTGQTLAEVRGEGWANALHPEDRERARQVWAQATRTRGLYLNEYRLRMSDGAYRWVRARGVPLVNEQGGITEWIGILEDIHGERVAMERERFLDGATQLLTASLDWRNTIRTLARHCVPFLADYASVDLAEPGGEIRRADTAHVDPAKEPVVRELWARYPYRRDEPFGVPQVLRTGEPLLVPDFPWDAVRRFARDDEHLAMLTTLGPRSYIAVPLTARGVTFGAISLVYADSGRRYSQEDFELARNLASRASIAVDNARLYQEAQHANEAKSDFLAMMSHELRTPLNAIAGHTELLQLGVHGELAPEQTAALTRIQRSQHHLLALVNNVLNFARLEAGSVHYDITDVRIDDVLADAEAAVGPQFRARELTLRMASDPGHVVRADRDKVLQIVLNLLSNAAKFTPAGGVVTVSSEGQDGQVALRVADNGRGIPADKLQMIFEPFVQLNRSLTNSMEGAGLGLAISRDLARAMGGELHVESTVGQGSTFTLTLTTDANA